MVRRHRDSYPAEPCLHRNLGTGKNALQPAAPRIVKAASGKVREGVHEAIVPREVFEAVGRLLRTDSRISPSQEIVYPFSGIARCGSCGNTLTRRTVGKYKYYTCAHTKDHEVMCAGCHIAISKFDARTYELMNAHIIEVMEMRQKLASGDYDDKFQHQIALLQKEVNKMDCEIDHQQHLIDCLIPNFRKGIISKSECQWLRESFQTKLDQVKWEKKKLLKKIQWIRDNSAAKCEWAEQFAIRAGQTVFSRKDVAMLVEYVFLYRDKHIEIRFVHDEEFQYIKKIME